jgi:urea transporter
MSSDGITWATTISFKLLPIMKLLERKLPFADTVLKGVGQIMLQENALTGLLFLIGVFYDGAVMGIAAILATACGTLTARLLQYDKAEIQKGLYGFSAALVGVAITFYFQPVLLAWVAIIIGSAMASLLQHLFMVKKIPVFTLPFVLVTWFIIYLFHHVYPVAPSNFLNAKATVGSDFTAAVKGYGQVIFQGSVFAGIIFFLGVFINSPVSVLYGIGGSILGAALAALLSQPIEGIEMGLFGYNAVLCAIVFAGDKPKNGIFALIAAILSVFVTLMMNKYGFVALTFPFVLATGITLIIKKYLSPPVTKLNTQAP